MMMGGIAVLIQKSPILMHISHPRHKGLGLCLEPIEGNYECHIEQVWVGFRHFGRVDMLCARCARFAAMDFKIIQDDRERSEAYKKGR